MFTIFNLLNVKQEFLFKKMRLQAINPGSIKVYLYRTRPRLDGIREEMVEIKQTKVVYTKRESERGTRL